MLCCILIWVPWIIELAMLNCSTCYFSCKYMSIIIEILNLIIPLTLLKFSSCYISLSSEYLSADILLSHLIWIWTLKPFYLKIVFDSPFCQLILFCFCVSNIVKFWLLKSSSLHILTILELRLALKSVSLNIILGINKKCKQRWPEPSSQPIKDKPFLEY